MRVELQFGRGTQSSRGDEEKSSSRLRKLTMVNKRGKKSSILTIHPHGVVKIRCCFSSFIRFNHTTIRGDVYAGGRGPFNTILLSDCRQV